MFGLVVGCGFCPGSVCVAGAAFVSGWRYGCVLVSPGTGTSRASSDAPILGIARGSRKFLGEASPTPTPAIIGFTIPPGARITCPPEALDTWVLIVRSRAFLRLRASLEVFFLLVIVFNIRARDFLLGVDFLGIREGFGFLDLATIALIWRWTLGLNRPEWVRPLTPPRARPANATNNIAVSPATRSVNFQKSPTVRSLGSLVGCAVTGPDRLAP